MKREMFLGLGLVVTVFGALFVGCAGGEQDPGEQGAEVTGVATQEAHRRPRHPHHPGGGRVQPPAHHDAGAAPPSSAGTTPGHRDDALPEAPVE